MAMAFGEYFPNPELNAKYSSGGVYEDKDVTILAAMFTEFWGTLVLAFVIFALTHKSNHVLGKYERVGVPFMIGCTVACLLGLYAPITQAGWNPARDFGPRIAAACGGWGSVAIPGPRNGFWIYIVGPFLGGPTGAFLADMVVHGDRLFLNIDTYTKKDEAPEPFPFVVKVDYVDAMGRKTKPPPGLPPPLVSFTVLPDDQAHCEELHAKLKKNRRKSSSYKFTVSFCSATAF